MVGVLVVNNQQLLQEAIKKVVEKDNDFEIIGVADNGRDALSKIDAYQPDIVIMNFKLPILNGIEVTERIRAKGLMTKIILLTDEESHVNRLIKGIMAGANGILEGKKAFDELYHVIHLVTKKFFVITNSVNELLKGYISKMSTNWNEIVSDLLKEKGVFLTEREIEVVNLLRLGFTNQQMVDYLDITMGTVKNYVSNIYHAINIRHRKQAVEFLQETLKEVDFFDNNYCNIIKSNT